MDQKKFAGSEGYGKLVVAEVEMKKRIKAAGLEMGIEEVLKSTFLFVPENPKCGAFTQCFKVASIEIKDDQFLRLTIANQPSGSIEPRLVVFNGQQQRGYLFLEHQLEHGGGHCGFLTRVR